MRPAVVATLDTNPEHPEFHFVRVGSATVGYYQDRHWHQIDNRWIEPRWNGPTDETRGYHTTHNVDAARDALLVALASIGIVVEGGPPATGEPVAIIDGDRGNSGLTHVAYVGRSVVGSTRPGKTRALWDGPSHPWPWSEKVHYSAECDTQDEALAAMIADVASFGFKIEDRPRVVADGPTVRLVGVSGALSAEDSRRLADDMKRQSGQAARTARLDEMDRTRDSAVAAFMARYPISFQKHRMLGGTGDGIVSAIAITSDGEPVALFASIKEGDGSWREIDPMAAGIRWELPPIHVSAGRAVHLWHGKNGMDPHAVVCGADLGCMAPTRRALTCPRCRGLLASVNNHSTWGRKNKTGGTLPRYLDQWVAEHGDDLAARVAAIFDGRTP